MTTIVEDIVKEIATQEENEPAQDIINATAKTIVDPSAENALADIELAIRLIKELLPLMRGNDAIRQIVRWLF